MERKLREGYYRAEAAGHLLAELQRSADEFQHGWISATEMRSRIEEIRRAKELIQDSDLNVLISITEQMRVEYEGSCEVAQRARAR